MGAGRRASPVRARKEATKHASLVSNRDQFSHGPRARLRSSSTGDHVYLLARVSSATLDSLAAFETSRENMEDDLCDEPEETDQEHDGAEPGQGQV